MENATFADFNWGMEQFAVLNKSWVSNSMIFILTSESRFDIYYENKKIFNQNWKFRMSNKWKWIISNKCNGSLE